jgi:NTE family protein
MSTIDLVFEGGGAKGMVFVGALEELFKDGDRTPGRLLGTSAGAITAAILAAGYTPAEMLEALREKDANDKSVFAAFMAEPMSLGVEAVRQSDIGKLLADLDLPLLPDAVEKKVDTLIARKLAGTALGRHLVSFVDRGGWYAADPFLAWIQRKLNEGHFAGKPRQFGGLTLEEFHAATGSEMTLVAADTTASRLLLLNHRTAPRLPVRYAVRMSMSIPLLWQEVVWDAAWGPYQVWDPAKRQLVDTDIVGHAIVDGGLLSNFPISLFLADRPDVAAVVGPVGSGNVMGLLIDETLPVPGRPAPAPAATGIAALRTVQRLKHIVDTATNAHDNMAKAVFAQHVVRLPAAGYGTTQFDMTDAEREALVEGGRQAMREYLAPKPASMRRRAAAPRSATSLANEAAAMILQR